ncbi:hypothetical protein HC026_06590 [Lactobacillus sp. LC28-10]|uniref:Malate permease n=1 Tax=Secundilactobacillus angelensis TaxID=2722706 RepID=A0ABX1L2P2_9LACO|nr:AEC family transporter [Secundilactobacillus angelensis]MCH5461752.1 AEC family transporter [Secundilactobacillus angelensis]NLR18591.1 hypothetical protein [Secundilactobacillus angelensis]
MLSVFLVSMNSVLIIITIIVIGIIIRNMHIVSDQFSTDISNVLIDVALPLSIMLLTQRYVTKNNFKILTVGTILIMVAILICFFIAYLISRGLKLDKSRRSIFINGFVNSNTLFVGMPLNIALFGIKSMPYFLCYFVANTIATWGIGVKIVYKDGPQNRSTSSRKPLKRLVNLFTPPMWGFILGLIFFATSFEVTGFLKESFSYIGNLVTPLSLMFLGLQLGKTKFSEMKVERLDLMAQFGKFVVSPFVMLLVIVAAQRMQIVSLGSIFIKTMVVQAATPMLNVLPILADQAKMDIPFSTRILTESILIFPVAVVVIMLLV